MVDTATLIKYFETFRERGGATAFVYRRGYRTVRWSYRTVAERACQFARELEARGIHKGDRVILWGDNSAEWVAAFWGCLLRGAVVVPMDRIASSEFAVRVARQVNAPLGVCARELSAVPLGCPVLILEDLTAQLERRETHCYPLPPLDRTDIVEIVFTSGTTADPKGVVLSHGNVLANLIPLESEINRYLKYERFVHPLRFLNLLPLSHVFGQFLGIFVPQLLGGVVVFQDTLNPAEVIRTVRTEKVSVLIAVPRLLQSLRSKTERDFESAGRLDLFRAQFGAAANEHFLKRWWRFRSIHKEFGWKFWAFICGGAALDSETELFWNRLSFAVIQGYGLTETTSLVSLNHPFKLGKGSIGKVLAGREVKLAANGEILVRGASIASAYFQNADFKPAQGEAGWFHTGDVGELDAEGNLYFKGRKKDVIVTPAGMKVYPEDLEGALKSQPGVKDCVVVGLERDGNAEPCAVLIMNEGAAVEQAVRSANRSLADFQQVRHWTVWPENDFPRTSTQKPRRAVIQAFAAGQSQHAGAAAAGSTLAELISRITGRPVSALPPDANLATDLSLTSLERVELLGALEDRYQLNLNESRFSCATTVADLEQMLRRPESQRSDYRYPRWAQSRPAALLRLVVYYLLSWPATMLMARPRVVGREQLGSLKGPALFVSNHITQVDIGFILAALPRRFRHRLAVAMLGELLREMRHPSPQLGLWRRTIKQASYGLVVALFNVFPLPQQTGFRESFAYAGESVDRGHSILVFPEGRRTQDGRLSPFRAGIGMLAKNLNLPVVPVRILGLFELKQARRKFAPGAVAVAIGKPLHFDPAADAASVAGEIERAVASLETISGKAPLL